MKTIGLLGGMSWRSTVTYYEKINRIVNLRLGGLHSAKILLNSVDFHEVNRVENLLEDAASVLDAEGADFLVLCTNTMHRLAESIQLRIGIPLLHIADCTAERITGLGLVRVGLLGTRPTMEHNFYRGRLREHGVETLVPEAPATRKYIHDTIHRELCAGTLASNTRLEYNRIIEELVSRGAQGIILGCTEIGLLVKAAYVNVPLFDTAIIHAEEAARYALEA